MATVCVRVARGDSDGGSGRGRAVRATFYRFVRPGPVRSAPNVIPDTDVVLGLTLCSSIHNCAHRREIAS